MADIIELIYEDHQWLRTHFFLLDDATEVPDLTAIWEPLATRLDTHADAEENVFYPALLAHGDAGNPEEVWYEAVGTARTENGKHLDEEGREAMPDFIKSSTPAQRHDLAMAWLRFYHQHAGGENVNTADKDPDTYIAEHT